MDNEISLKIINVVNKTAQNQKVNINNKTSISELLNYIGYQLGDLSRYYELSGDFSYNNSFLPFLIIEDRVLYDVQYKNAKVYDFIHTFSLSGKGIEIEIGQPFAGGPDYCTLSEMWDSAKTILESTGVLCSISGISMMGLTKWLCDKFKNRKRTPHVIFDVIYSREIWNHYELASLLEIDPNRAKDLLKGIGFKYDNNKKVYIQGDDTIKIKEKLMNIKKYSE